MKKKNHELEFGILVPKNNEKQNLDEPYTNKKCCLQLWL